MLSAQDQLLEVMRENNDLLRVIARSALASTLREELQDPKHRKLYDLTGGDDPVQVLARKVGMSVGAISAVWKRWEEKGLLLKNGKRYTRSLS